MVLGEIWYLYNLAQVINLLQMLEGTYILLLWYYRRVGWFAQVQEFL